MIIIHWTTNCNVELSIYNGSLFLDRIVLVFYCCYSIGNASNGNDLIINCVVNLLAIKHNVLVSMRSYINLCQIATASHESWNKSWWLCNMSAQTMLLQSVKQQLTEFFVTKTQTWFTDFFEVCYNI